MVWKLVGLCAFNNVAVSLRFLSGSNSHFTLKISELFNNTYYTAVKEFFFFLSFFFHPP